MRISDWSSDVCSSALAGLLCRSLLRRCHRLRGLLGYLLLGGGLLRRGLLRGDLLGAGLPGRSLLRRRLLLRGLLGDLLLGRGFLRRGLLRLDLLGSRFLSGGALGCHAGPPICSDCLSSMTSG